jgi:hypothetical protein
MTLQPSLALVGLEAPETGRVGDLPGSREGQGGRSGHPDPPGLSRPCPGCSGPEARRRTGGPWT